MARKTYIVEHLDDELGPWSELEYLNIAQESHAAGSNFCLSSVPSTLKLPQSLRDVPDFTSDERSVEDVYAATKDRVCLLDPAATRELAPEDGESFDVFLFGGILGKSSHLAGKEIGSLIVILGDDPPRDRTSELRKKGFQGRRLGPTQMTTDTAVRVRCLPSKHCSLLTVSTGNSTDCPGEE